MKTKRMTMLAVSMMILIAVPLVAQTVIPLAEDQNDLEFVGQFQTNGPDSLQFGYISRIEGLNNVFSGTPHNETTALFTFVTHATTYQLILNGPFRVVDRTGTTTIYLNNGPSDFNNPASFSQGTPIQTSTYRQHVIVNLNTLTFTTTHMNTITDTEMFSRNGVNYRLGHPNDMFRTSYQGVVNSLDPVNHVWFAGSAVGVH